MSAEIWAFYVAYQDQIVGLGFSIALAVILFVFRPRVRLFFGNTSRSLNNLSVADPATNGQRKIEFYSEKFFLQNSGSKPASSIRFVLSRRPSDVSVFPPCDYSEKNLPKGEYQITIPTLAPRETVAVDCFYVDQVASVVVNVKCNEVVGKPVIFQAFRLFPRWVYIGVWILIFAGVAFVVQVLRALL